jgi:uncharacterized protein
MIKSLHHEDTRDPKAWFPTHGDTGSAPAFLSREEQRLPKLDFAGANLFFLWSRFAILATFVVALIMAMPGHAQEPDPAAIAKAKELMEVSEARKLGDQMLSVLEAPLVGLFESANPGRRTEISEFMRERFLPEMRRRLPEFWDLAAAVYAKHFTVAELDELKAFYESPLGRKVIAEQGGLMTELSQIGQVWGGNVAKDLLRRMAREIEDRGLTMPKI